MRLPVYRLTEASVDVAQMDDDVERERERKIYRIEMAGSLPIFLYPRTGPDRGPSRERGSKGMEERPSSVGDWLAYLAASGRQRRLDLVR